MIVVNKLKDLERFGIVLLTGEADALSYRILCDLTHSGQRLICESYGIKPEGFANSWNNGTKDNPHVASIMLAWDAWRQIGPIALTNCYSTVLQTDCSLFAIEADEQFDKGQFAYDQKTDEIVVIRPTTINGMEWPEECYGKIQRYFAYQSGSRVGSRNVHAMSGRVS